MKGKKKTRLNPAYCYCDHCTIGGYARYYGIYRGHGAGADSTYV